MLHRWRRASLLRAVAVAVVIPVMPVVQVGDLLGQKG
jgi:hypothetical protein